MKSYLKLDPCIVLIVVLQSRSLIIQNLDTIDVIIVNYQLKIDAYLSISVMARLNLH